MRFKLFLVSLALLLFAPLTSFADAAPTKLSQTSTCIVYEMCSAITGGTDCTVLPASGDEVVLNMAGSRSVTFYSMQSTASAYSCDVMSNDTGHDAATPTGNGYQVNAESITESQEVLTLEGTLAYIWITCSSVTDNAVTITANVCQ